MVTGRRTGQGMWGKSLRLVDSDAGRGVAGFRSVILGRT